MTEQNVVQLAVRGVPTKVIAHDLGSSPSTVSTRLARAARKAGLSNAEIATIRARSSRTVANQVASILRKTQSGSRRGLVCLRLEQCRTGTTV